MGIEDLERIRLEANWPFPAEAIREAVQSESNLRKWLASEAAFDPWIDGRAELRGSDVFPASSATSLSGRVTAWSDTEFGFPIGTRGRVGEVRLQWAPSEGGSHVVFSASFPGNEDSHAWWVGWDGLKILAFNLRSFLATGHRSVTPDYGQVARKECRIDVEIEADPNAVWRALSEPGPMKAIFGEGARVELRQGGAYTYGWGEGGPSRIVALDPVRSLRTDWSYEGEPNTEVQWEVRGEGNRTRLTVEHFGLSDAHHLEEYIQGWSCFLASIASYVERGTPAP